MGEMNTIHLLILILSIRCTMYILSLAMVILSLRSRKSDLANFKFSYGTVPPMLCFNSCYTVFDACPNGLIPESVSSSHETSPNGSRHLS